MLKIDLANEASNIGMSLSEYVETIAENRNANKNILSSDFNELNQQMQEIQRKLTFFYEEPMMKNAFEKYRGQVISYIDKDGISRKDTIDSIEDVYTILFKTNKIG